MRCSCSCYDISIISTSQLEVKLFYWLFVCNSDATVCAKIRKYVHLVSDLLPDHLPLLVLSPVLLVSLPLRQQERLLPQLLLLLNIIT